jgi:CBS domain-containing protein
MTSETLHASDLMAATLITVPPDMPVGSIARLLSERAISSVPVTDAAGKLLGIVTEADLLRRVAGKEDAVRSWIAACSATTTTTRPGSMRGRMGGPPATS